MNDYSPIDLQAAIDTVQKQRDYAELYPLGVCQNCPRPAAVEGPDGYGYCPGCARGFARKILATAAVANAHARHCSTPAQRKARAKRRKARKAAK